MLEWASGGGTNAWSPLLDPIKHLGHDAHDRGFRLGLWCDGRAHNGEPLAVGDGRRLRFEVAGSDSTLVGDGQDFDFDLDSHTLTKRPTAARREPEWLQTRAIRENERDAIDSALGESTLSGDQVVVFDGLPALLLMRWWIDWSTESPLTILDLAANRVLAHPRLYDNRGWSWPDIGHVMYADEAGVLIIRGAYGREFAAYSTGSWERLWFVPQDDTPDRIRDVRVRGGLLFVDDLREVYDVVTGERRFDIESAPVRVTDVLEGGRLLVGASSGEIVVMDGGDRSTILFLWFDRGADVGADGSHVVGVDGTFAVPARTIRNGHVLHAGRFVPASELAPWLWDPLHVRSLTDDQARARRDIPLGR